MIHGHVPMPIATIRKNLVSANFDINIDNGCVRAKLPDYGHLLCLDIDSRELVWQKNLDLNPVKQRSSVHANFHEWE